MTSTNWMTNNMDKPEKNNAPAIMAVIEEEIMMLETLQDDFNEFIKGCTDAEQDILNKASLIIGDYIKKASERGSRICPACGETGEQAFDGCYQCPSCQFIGGC